MTTPSDPQRGGQQPDQGPGSPEPGPEPQQPSGDAGQPGPHGQQPPAQPGGHGQPPQYDPYAQQGQYGGQPAYGQQQPPYNPYGQPGQYGQQQPGQYGQQPPYNPYGQPGQQPGQYGQYGQQQPGQYGGSPYGAQYGQGYNPYGGAAGLDAEDEPVKRPGVMVLSLVLLILSALPFLATGALLLSVPIDPSMFPPGLDLEAQMQEVGLTMETLVTGIRTVGVVMLALALLYVLFAVLAFVGRSWARILLTIMTAVFTLVLLAGTLTGLSGDTGSLLLLLVIVACAVGGTIILFMPEPSRWFRRARA